MRQEVHRVISDFFFQRAALVLMASLIFFQCREKRDTRFEPNISFANLSTTEQDLIGEFDEVILFTFYDEGKLRREYRMLAHKENEWRKVIFFSDALLMKIATPTKIGELIISDHSARMLLLGLSQAHYFDLQDESILLKQQQVLCGRPSDPSHYLTYELVLFRDRSVRRVSISNPTGRFEACPAIRQWQHAATLSEIFFQEWEELIPAEMK